MTPIKRFLGFVHWTVLGYLGIFSIPALSTNFLSSLSPTLARSLERMTPWFSLLMWAWLLCLPYFFACLLLSESFRERLLARLAGFRERDEREEIVTAQAARATLLVALGCFLVAGFAGMVQMNIFSLERFHGEIPPAGRIEGKRWIGIHRPAEAKFMMWPSLGVSVAKSENEPDVMASYRNDRTVYYYERGTIARDMAKYMFAFLALLVLVFHLFARRIRIGYQP